MTRKGALQELLVKARAGGTVSAREASRIWPNGYAHAVNAGSGSMDAALSLFEAVLPGWHVEEIRQCQGGWLVRLQTMRTPKPQPYGQEDTPSRALLIAILEALVAMEFDT